jgi:RNA polymerase sigma-70 factor (ECF subfamily)
LYKNAGPVPVKHLHDIWELTFKDEVHLAGLSKKGDKNVFTVLIEQYQSKLYRTAYAVVGNSQDAYNALQDCILKTYLSIDTLKNDYYVSYWINRILIDSCNDLLRR